jgi:hypothetical protein
LLTLPKEDIDDQGNGTHSGVRIHRQLKREENISHLGVHSVETWQLNN